MRFRKLSLILIALTLSVAPLSRLNAQKRNGAYLSYIDQYKKEAVRQMNKYKIPASITLAQGLLESDAGRSMLAVEGNNHFGIKCHSDWTGRKVYYDDDSRGECFRKYKSALASYEDHSLFLVNGSRYASLFDLRQTDYKGWARGLKKAGYATNPQYAEKLISIIELYDLNKFDRPGGGVSSSSELGSVHQPYLSNGLLYVVLGPDESLKDIAREFNTTRCRLRRYNEMSRKFIPLEGSVIYLERKKCRASKDYTAHTVGQDDSLWSISQLYGVRTRCLIRKNHLDTDKPISVGMTLRIR
ncbi:MAG: glucosaminidase domain-containing protein [Bacteroidaceae bacterium]|nr:glucosaminidase domain-containing protein [Bacteroidaceae bacterium]